VSKRVAGAVDGNFAGLDVDGNLTDSGSAPSDFATAAQGALADSAIQPGDNVSELVNDAGYEQQSNKGVANGYTPLDAGGKVDPSFLPFSGMTPKGTFGSGGSTTGGDLPPAGESGDYYICDTDNYNSAEAGLTFDIGDWAVDNGVSWNKIDNSDAVSSVFGRLGAVVAQLGDYVTSLIANDSVVAGATLNDVISALNTAITNNATAISNLDSSDVANVSGVVGALVTDALNQLNTDVGNNTAAIAAIGTWVTVGGVGEYLPLPGGAILQRGSIAVVGAGTSIAMPIAFNNTNYRIFGTYHGAAGDGGGRMFSLDNGSKAVGSITGYVHQVDTHGAFGGDVGSQDTGGTIDWFAIGD